MMAKIPSPYLRQLREFISFKDNLHAQLTTSKGGIIEVRQPVSVQVVDREGKLHTWEAKPGQVLMTFSYELPEPLFLEMQAILGFSQKRVPRVQRVKDIYGALRQQARHILNNLITERDKVREQVFCSPGEYDQLGDLLEKLEKINPQEAFPDELEEEAQKLFANVRNGWKVKAREALQRGDVEEAKNDIAARLEQILDIADAIMKRIRELRRIINKIEFGFDTCWLRMNGVILKLEDPNLDPREHEKLATYVHEKIFLYLTWRVSTFEPFHGWGHSKAVLALENVPALIRAGDCKKALRYLKRAKASIEKGVKGVTPEVRELRNIQQRIATRKQ